MRRSISSRPAVLLLGSLCLAAMANAALAAADRSPANAPPGNILAVDLEYREAANSLVSYSLSRRPGPVAFTKEPDFGQGQVERGTLRFGSYTNSVVPYAWDRSRGKLYLDLNGNLDLTDDPGGVFTCPHADFTISNVHLAFRTPAGPRRFLVDLRLGLDRDQVRYGAEGTVSLRSLWEGKMAVQGQEWQVGIVENTGGPPDSPGAGYLLLRPWAARNDPIAPHNSTPDLIPLPRRLFWQNQAYAMNCRWGAGGVPRWRLEFQEQQPKLGEARINGALLHRVVLIGEPEWTVVLDAPGSIVSLPVGRYDVRAVWLRKGAAQAQGAPQRSFDVSDQRAVTVSLGGPLTNSVTVTRRGKRLQAAYQLAGAGGDVYRLSGPQADTPPQATVYRAGKKLATGQFVFG